MDDNSDRKEAQPVANLTATPNPVPYGAGLGTTTITWSTGESLSGQIYLSVDGGPKQLFARGSRGSQEAPWINTGNSYEFRLYAGADCEAPLSTLTVTRDEAPRRIEELARHAFQEKHSGDTVRMLANIIKRHVHSPAYQDTFRLWEEHGFHITPVHFYQPIPDTRSLPDNLWERESELVGLDMNDDVQLRLLREICPRYRAEYDQFPADSPERPHEFYFNNGSFSGTDALVLYCMVRYFRPNLIIEVGSGFLSRMSAQAALKNEHTELVCIDPYADVILTNGFPGVSSVITKEVQQVGLDLFQRLGAGDILFIDTSHVVKCGGEVNHLFFEILPRVNPGGIVHIHDIFIPWEYPREWVMSELKFYTEQYLLQAFLSFNSAFEVLVSNYYLGRKYQAEMKAAFPTSPWWGGGSFWMRRKRG